MHYRRTEKDEKTDLDRRLRLAVETIRSNALNCVLHGSAEDEKEGSGEERLRKQQGKWKADAVDSEHEDCSAITKYISEQREYDKNGCSWRRKSSSTARLAKLEKVSAGIKHMTRT